MALCLRIFICIFLMPFTLITTLILESFWRSLAYMINSVRYSRGCLKVYLILTFPLLYIILFILCLICAPIIFIISQCKFLTICTVECCCCCFPCFFEKKEKKNIKDTELEKDINHLFFYPYKHCVGDIVGDYSNVYNMTEFCNNKERNIENNNFIKFSVIVLLFPLVMILVIIFESFYRPIWIIKETYKSYESCVRCIIIVSFPFLFFFLFTFCMPSSIYCIAYNFGMFCDRKFTQESFINLFFYTEGHCVNACCGVDSINIYTCVKKYEIVSKPVINQNNMQQINLEVRSTNQENINYQYNQYQVQNVYNPNQVQNVPIQQPNNNDKAKKNVFNRFCGSLITYFKK